MQDDRPVGAVIAGLPTMAPPEPSAQSITATTVNASSDPWVYDRVPNLVERAHGTFQIGQKASPIAVGLRDHSLRTPGQYQQNFPRELAMSEAAVLAGVDPLEFRITQTRDERLIGVLEAVREASAWETRPSPRPAPAPSGSTPLKGQGVSVMLRAGTYWACVCQISVAPDTGQIMVDRYSIAVDPGVVVNPLQLKRQVQGGAMMGISHALHEEVTFDEGRVTTRDWRTYPILTMAEVPEVKVVIVARPDVGSYGGGSEAANALAAPAIAAAFFDATGRHARRLPLKAAYIQELLKASRDSRVTA
jgi:CO/xanthine dehydrogenase Mo-binding subunit